MPDVADQIYVPGLYKKNLSAFFLSRVDDVLFIFFLKKKNELLTNWYIFRSPKVIGKFWIPKIQVLASFFFYLKTHYKSQKITYQPHNNSKSLSGTKINLIKKNKRASIYFSLLKRNIFIKLFLRKEIY